MSFTSEIEQHLKLRLRKILPHHSTDEIYNYALFPSGKLLRSQLVLALAKDLTGNYHSHHLQVASFIEYHHAYTLIHDDLPCMDNDDFRRGKPTTHKAYNEWKALLAGDGLLVASYGELAEINSSHLKTILRFATNYTGPQGLIFGQIMDLNQEMNESIRKLIQTHRLKTARLFQLSFILSYYCSLNDKTKPDLKKILFFHRLGDELGIVFQLLDDLLDLGQDEVSPHELSINPFLKHPQEINKIFEQKLKNLGERLNRKNLPTVKKTLLDNYFLKTFSELKKNENKLKLRIKDYSPIKLTLDSFQL